MTKYHINDLDTTFGWQDNERNLLIQFTVLLATASFVVALFGVVSDFETYMFQLRHSKFKWIMISTSMTGFVVFFSVLWFLKYIKKPYWMMWAGRNNFDFCMQKDDWKQATIEKKPFPYTSLV